MPHKHFGIKNRGDFMELQTEDKGKLLACTLLCFIPEVLAKYMRLYPDINGLALLIVFCWSSQEVR